MISFAALETKAREIKDAPKEKAQAKLDTLFRPDLSKSKTNAQGDSLFERSLRNIFVNICNINHSK